MRALICRSGSKSGDEVAPDVSVCVTFRDWYPVVRTRRDGSPASVANCLFRNPSKKPRIREHDWRTTGLVDED